MFLLGGAMLAAMFLAPRDRPAIAPEAALGTPDRPLRFLAYNVYHNYRGLEANVEQVRKLRPPPEFVMLEEVELDQIGAMARAWEMPHVFHPGMYRGKPKVQGWPGVCLMSRHPLYGGRPLRTADGATFGVWAYAVVDGRKFAVAGVHLRATTNANPAHVLEMNQIRRAQLDVLIGAWEEEGRPPLVVGGDFNQPAVGGNYELMTDHFNDVLAAIGKDFVTHRWTVIETRIDYLLATKEWEPTGGGVIEGEASDHRPVWAELRANRTSPAMTTSSTATRPAPPSISPAAPPGPR